MNHDLLTALDQTVEEVARESNSQGERALGALEARVEEVARRRVVSV